MLIEHFKVVHAIYIHNAPAWDAAAAPSADLPTKQADSSILNTIVMRFNDSLVAFVLELEQPFVCNRTAKHLIQFLIDHHSIYLIT